MAAATRVEEGAATEAVVEAEGAADTKHPSPFLSLLCSAVLLSRVGVACH